MSTETDIEGARKESKKGIAVAGGMNGVLLLSAFPSLQV